MAHSSLCLLFLTLPFFAAAQENTFPTDSPETPTDENRGPDIAAGASGEDGGAFTLSKGGLAAIIVVVVVIAVFGIASLVLWYVAKKRQWEVRKSIRRASRRLTGRFEASKSRRQSRAGGVRVGTPPASKRANREIDLEKGPAQRRPKEFQKPKDKFKGVITSTSEVKPDAKGANQKNEKSNR